MFGSQNNPFGQFINIFNTGLNPLLNPASYNEQLNSFMAMLKESVPNILNNNSQSEYLKITFDGEKIAKLQQEYIDEATKLWNSSLTAANILSDAKDRRFKDSAWEENKIAAFNAALYLLNARTLMQLGQAAQGDEKIKARINFIIEQYIAAAAPSNYLTLNAEAQKKIIETKGESLARGFANIIHDLKQGHVSMTDESLFIVGKNVATTKGAVVFENDYFQLLEYTPSTEKVYEKPLLLVPPCINKYYILDLQAKNSFIKYCVDEGNRTFVVSWKNPDKTLEKATWDDYVENAVIEAIQRVQDITSTPKINTLGFCVGGTLLTSALAVLAAKNKHPAASATLLTTLIDFSDTGILDVFIDENMIKYREMQMGEGGLLKGSELASTFSFLRPNDLVWNYVVGNYLKGETPPPFDLLYWNSDSTNLPGPFYAWYLRNTYLENNLIKPAHLTICGQKIDLGKIKTPIYIYGSKEDHIVPIGGAYASTQAFKSKKRFVMGASGHIAGVINPPAANKRCYWTNDSEEYPANIENWIKTSQEHAGSWWTDWSDWLKTNAGKQIPAPQNFETTGKSGHQYKQIEPAPGRYVQEKS